MNWFDIFKTGTHQDSSGRDVTVTQADLDAIVAAYDPATHEAPIVIGHPKLDAPAYGWVKALRRDGDRLQVLPHQVEPQFAEMVRQGRFKKRSAKFVETEKGLALRHVGFLGAQPPAVKGLRDVSFAADEDGREFEFSDSQNEKTDSQDEKKEAAMEAEELKRQLEEERRKREEAEKKAKEAQDKADASAREFAEAEKVRRQERHVERFNRLVDDARALPAEKSAVLAFAEALAAQPGEFEFAEGDGRKPLVEQFWAFLEKRPEHDLYREFAQREKAGQGKDDEDLKMAERIIGGRGGK